MRAVLFMLLLGGCVAPAADGYRFQASGRPLSTVSVTLVEHRSESDLRLAGEKRGARAEGDIMGWSILKGSACEVHIMDPTIAWQPEWLGHEIAHCFYGRWHS